MLELNLNELVDITQGYLYGGNSNNHYTGVSTDTRTILKDNVFIAFKGERFNGNKCVEDAFKNGAAVCIVDELLFDISSLPQDKAVVLVKDTNAAIGKLAKYYLKKVNVKTIGVTGSCGKTSTKDMIAAALSPKYKVLKTLGNFNNHLGLPLTILRLDSSYDIAILEMGMSHAKEIEYLAEISRPDIAVITNIGLSHIENFDTQEGILKAKLEITSYFEKNNLLVINGDDLMLNKITSSTYPVIKVGTSSDLNAYASEISLNPLSSTFNYFDGKEILPCELYLPGKHNIINCMLSLVVADYLGLSVYDALNGIKSLEKTSMRLDMIDVNGYTIINDCYNASPDSMKSAIEVQQNLNSKRNIAVLGSMFELGDMSRECHYEVGKYILDKKIDLVLATGKYTDEYKNALKDKCICFDTKSDLICFLKNYIQSGDSILIKASRGAKFEEIYKSIL